MVSGTAGKSPTRRGAVGGMMSALAVPSLGRPTDSIVLGLTPVFLDSDLAMLKAIEQELSHRLQRPVALVKRRTYQEIMAMLLSGQVTAAWICGYPFVRYRDQLSILMAPVYQGAPLYRSYLIARADLPGSALTDFQGRTHAFSDPDSNSGWLVTRHLLAELGQTPESFFGGTFFTYGHRNVVRAVASGLADCGSVDGYVWDVLAEREPELASLTRVVLRSPLMGFPPIACLSTARTAASVIALGKALGGLSGNAGGRGVLDLLRLDGFIEADATLYDTIDLMYRGIPA